jgi:hypothetical protein
MLIKVILYSKNAVPMPAILSFDVYKNTMISVRSVLLGIAMGLAPITLCALLYYAVPLLVKGNAGALLSFAVLGLFLLSFITVFVFSIMMMVKGNALIGGCALAVLVVQFGSLIVFLS